MNAKFFFLQGDKLLLRRVARELGLRGAAGEVKYLDCVDILDDFVTMRERVCLCLCA